MHISFYVSGRATRLIKILDFCSKEILSSIALVVSDNSNTELGEKLTQFNIPLITIDYQNIVGNSLKKNIELSNSLLFHFRAYDVDYCFCFGDNILKGELLRQYENRIINFHPSILPLFPGRKAIDKALEAKFMLMGNTAHFIDKGIDTGPIILQNVVHKKQYDLHGYDGILDQQIPMFFQIYDWLSTDKLILKEDNTVEIKDSRYNQPVFFPKIEN